jgi:sortase A
MAPPISPLTGGQLRRTPGRRLVRDISWVLIITGLLLLADAAVTLLWQEPVTAVVASIKRSQIDQHYISARLSSPERRALAALNNERARIAFLAGREQRKVGTADAVGRIEIPRIGLSLLVVQGTDSASLEKGPGHYPSTALPGLGKTVAIAGHRTTYLAPFRHIDTIHPGDTISLVMPYGRFVYTVQYHRIVSPSAWWITNNVGYDRLVLSACNPLYSAAQRIVVFARLTSTRPTVSTRPPQRSSIAGVLPMMG